MDYIKKLIILFSEYPISQIEADGGQMLKDRLGVKQYQKIVALPDYEDNYLLLVECKEDIEDIVNMGADHNDQINECLHLLQETRHERIKDRFDILSELIKNVLYKKTWNKQEKDLYDKKYKIVVDWKDYFISYTNRDSPTTNSVFEELIKGIYLQLPPESDMLKMNYVARIIAKYFQINNLVGFYDFNDIKCGDDIEQLILSNCQGCFVFVQLVENQSLSTPPVGKDNWCLREYEHFKDNKLIGEIVNEKYDKKFYFIITTADTNELRPADLPPSYQSWFDHISNLHFMSLDKYKTFKKATDEKKLRAEISKLAGEIKKTRESILENILSC